MRTGGEKPIEREKGIEMEKSKLSINIYINYNVDLDWIEWALNEADSFIGIARPEMKTDPTLLLVFIEEDKPKILQSSICRNEAREKEKVRSFSWFCVSLSLSLLVNVVSLGVREICSFKETE